MQQVQQLSKMFGGLPARARFAVFAVAALTVVVLAFVVRASTHTDWRPVITGAEPGTIAKAQTVLDEKKIPYTTNDAGTTLMVAQSDMGKANPALAEAHVVGAGMHTTCGEEFSSSGGFMTSTSEQTRQKSRSCLQGEIANGIEGMAGVKSATVLLNIPSSDLFAEKKAATTASVKITSDGSGRIGDGLVKAIKEFTANAAGMKVGDVTVSDEMGLLSGQAEGSTAMAKQLDVEAKYNAYVEQKLTSAFERIAGPDKVVVTSNADLDMDQVHEQTKDFGGEDNQQGPMSAEDTAGETLKGAGTDGGAAGASSNTASTGSNQIATTGSTDSTKSYNQLNRKANYDNDVVVNDRIVTPGSVKSNSISVVVDSSVPAATVAAIKNSAQAWMGGHPNDSFSYDNAPLAQAVESKEDSSASRRAALSSFLKWLVAGLGLVGMAALMRGHLNQRTEELLYPDEPFQLDAGSLDPIPLAELEAMMTRAASGGSRKRMELQRQVERIAVDKPADVATQLRSWLMEDPEAAGYASGGQR